MKSNELRKIQRKAIRLKLIGAELTKLPMIKLKVLCNGIGAECFPTRWRKFIDKVNPNFTASAMIHDIMWSIGYDFTRSNDILYINGKWEAMAAYAWYNPMRYIAIARARLFAKVCQKFGYIAYMQASWRKK